MSNNAIKKEQANFRVKVENGVVKEIGRSYVAMPEVRFKGGSIKWYEDKVFNLGTLQTGKVEISDNILSLDIEISNVSYRMNQTINKAIEEAKHEVSSDTWSSKPVVKDNISLLVTFSRDKSFNSVLCVRFHDADNKDMDTECNIFIDLSNYADELKSLAKKALEETFF